MALLKRKRAGLGDAMDVVTRFVNACNRHDADGVYSCLHPDFDSIQPMYPTRNFRGADQVRRNWQAIFDAEPGFRLTVLRSAAMDDTVWLELHGAGEDAEVAGVFIMGIQGDRIRWARIYSALVEPVPEGVGEPPAAALREVPPYEEPAPAAAGAGEVVEEALIAPVLDMDRSGRRHRRRRRSGGEGEAVEGTDEAPDAEHEGDDTVAVVIGDDAGATAVVSGSADLETVVVVEGDADVAVVEGDDEVAVVVEGDADVTAVVDAGPEGEAEAAGAPAVDAGPQVDAAAGAGVVDAGPEGEVETAGAGADVTVVTAEPEPEPEVLVAAPPDDDGGPPTEAVDMVTIATDEPEPEPEPQPEPEPAPAPDAPGEEPPRRLFGRRRP